MNVTNFKINDNYIYAKDQGVKKLVFPVLQIDTDPTGAASFITDASGRAVLIDVGDADNLSALVLAMQTAGVEFIDAIFITHWHLDHCGNLASLANYYDLSNTICIGPKVPSFYAAGELRRQSAITQFGANFKDPSNGDEFEFMGITFSCYNCSAADMNFYNALSTQNYNNASMIIYATYENNRICFTGDLATAGQFRAQAQGYIIKSDLVTVPHHGVDQDGLMEPFEYMGARYAYISNTPLSYTHGLRSPVIAAIIERGLVYDNATNRSLPVVAMFDGYNFGVSGEPLDITTYSIEGKKIIYCDPSISEQVYQDGTQSHPFKSMRRAISACNSKNNCIELLSDYDDTIVITGNQGFVEIHGNGNQICTWFGSFRGAQTLVEIGRIAGAIEIGGDYAIFSDITIDGDIDLTNAKTFFNNCIFNYADGDIIDANRSEIYIGEPVTPNRTGLLIDGNQCTITGAFSVADINYPTSTPVVKNVNGFTDLGRLTEGNSATILNIFDPTGCPMVFYTTDDNKLVHILSDGTVKTFSPD